MKMIPDHSTIREVVEKVVAQHQDPTGQALNILNDIQSYFHYLPEEVLEEVALLTEIPYSRLYSIGTFFKDFSLEPVGQYIIKVCNGTTCHTRGAPQIIQALESELKIKVGQTTSDGLFTLHTVDCVGACSLAPVVMVNTKTFGRLRLADATHVLNICEEKRSDVELNA